MARPVHCNPSPCLRLLSPSSSNVFRYVLLPPIPLRRSYKVPDSFRPLKLSSAPSRFSVECSAKSVGETLKTCKNCKTQFDPSLNHPGACRFHTAHFGGETKRKFESVYSGGTMNTPNSGEVYQYWHCCGSEDQFDPGCTAAPHASYDDD